MLGEAKALPRDFWYYFAGESVSAIGSAFAAFALPLVVYELTGSASSLGLSMAASFLPYPLFGLVIGALADRLDRKRMMIVTDVLRAAVMGILPLLAAFDALRVGWIYPVAFVSTVLRIFFDAGAFAGVAAVVPAERLITANSLIQGSQAVSRVAGPVLAGIMVAVVPTADLLLVDAASFLVSAAGLLMVRVGFNTVPAKDRPGAGARGRALLSALRADIAEGLRFVWYQPVLRALSLMMIVVNVFEAAAIAQLVLFAKERLSATDTQVSLLYAAGAVGVVVLSTLAGPLRRRYRFGPVVLSLLAIDGLAIAVFALTTWYWLALALWAVKTGVGILFNINTLTLRQRLTPNEMLGRVMTVASVLSWGAVPIGALVGGFVISATGRVDLAYLVVGLVTAGTALAFGRSALNRADYPADSPSAEVLSTGSPSR